MIAVIFELVIGLILAIIGILGFFGVIVIGTNTWWPWVGIALGLILLILALLQQRKHQ